MEMSLRWFGPDDQVSLENIKQIPGVTGIVSALHHIPNGEVWPVEEIQERKKIIEEAGFNWCVVESVPLHEDIKRGLPTRDLYIDAWIESMRNIASAGIKVICYVYMPVLDWTRTDLGFECPDKSRTLKYVHEDLEKFDGSLPGWEEAYSAEELKEAIAAYDDIDEDKYWSHLEYFLNAVIPIAEELGVKLAIHPDDPPFSLFGLPKIIKNEASIKRLMKLVDSPANGFTFCTGSYGILPDNDLPQMIKTAGDRIHFVHARNINRTRISDDTIDFEESTHHIGDLDLAAVMRALVEIGFEGAIRPDHGRAIWGETGRPGYWLHDRALGAQYLLGLEKAYKDAL
jgi:mannonate dehydratase